MTMKHLLRLSSLSAGLLCASLVGCADAEPALQEEDAPSATSGVDHQEATPLQQEAAGESDKSGLECYKLLAHAGDYKAKFKVGAKKDTYFNFTFKAPWQGTAYGIQFNPIIDNKQVIHHWLLFQTPGTTAAGIATSIGAHPAGALLSGWAPGGEPVNMRELAEPGEDIGVELTSTNTYTVEIHYNSADPNALDASGVEICVQKQKPKNIAGLSWLGWDQLGAPAAKWTGTCRPNIQQPVKIIGVVPHMHKTGTHMKTTINRKDGTKEILHDKPFDFNYQIQYNVKATINPGDSLTTECTFARPMAFGTGTDAEMCYNFTLSYPRNALSDGGLWGTIAHGAGACLGQ
jgi:hypothetical protein